MIKYLRHLLAGDPHKQQRSLLQDLLANNNFLAVEIPHDPDIEFQSMIIKVDKDCFELDEIWPKDRCPTLAPGEKLKIKASLNHVPVAFVCKIIKVKKQLQGYSYDMSFPLHTPLRNRRQFFRTPIPGGEKISLDLKRIKDYSYTVNNISRGGINVTLEDNLTEQFVKNQILSACTLIFPDGKAICFDLEIRNSVYKRQPHRHTIISARFSSIDSADRKRLSHYIANLQHEYKKSKRPLAKSRV